jgi:hypothetical protein
MTGVSKKYSIPDDTTLNSMRSLEIHPATWYTIWPVPLGTGEGGISYAWEK